MALDMFVTIQLFYIGIKKHRLCINKLIIDTRMFTPGQIPSFFFVFFAKLEALIVFAFVMSCGIDV